ncbi:MAG: hypothetical protein GY833_16660 [Aestuariibacter sp.]|nr:hypothetical protein [Aestuariibacter sp.]
MKKILVMTCLMLVVLTAKANAEMQACRADGTGATTYVSCSTAGALNVETVTNVASGTVVVTDGTETIQIDASGNLQVGGTLTVTATDLDIRDLTAASDTVSIEGGNAVDVSIDDGGNTITVDGTVTATEERLATFEYDNTTITATSLTNGLVAAAADSDVLSLYNGGAGSLFCVMCDDAACSGETTPAVNTGLEIPSGSGKTWESVTVRAVNCYNEDAANADVSIEWRR